MDEPVVRRSARAALLGGLRFARSIATHRSSRSQMSTKASYTRASAACPTGSGGCRPPPCRCCSTPSSCVRATAAVPGRGRPGPFPEIARAYRRPLRIAPAERLSTVPRRTSVIQCRQSSSLSTRSGSVFRIPSVGWSGPMPPGDRHAHQSPRSAHRSRVRRVRRLRLPRSALLGDDPRGPS